MRGQIVCAVRVLSSIGAFLLCLSAPLPAQVEVVHAQAEQAETHRDGKRKGQFVPAPIPIVNPTLGNGLGVVLMYMYNLDEESRVSYTGAGGLYTDTESWGVGVAQEANFAKDNWRVKGGALYFDLNLIFYGIGNEDGERGASIPLAQSGAAIGARALRRVRGPGMRDSSTGTWMWSQRSICLGYLLTSPSISRPRSHLIRRLRLSV